MFTHILGFVGIEVCVKFCNFIVACQVYIHFTARPRHFIRARRRSYRFSLGNFGAMDEKEKKRKKKKSGEQENYLSRA
ncbi:hypothetical protein PUN28_007424 [Cardiocondyla obscurior]|uniref:Secreted protein n=1 Tax=Cardiocondyla obscurior TaxID=286306 RepID=A0AAW2G9G8_9HYME